MYITSLLRTAHDRRLHPLDHVANDAILEVGTGLAPKSFLISKRSGNEAHIHVHAHVSRQTPPSRIPGLGTRLGARSEALVSSPTSLRLDQTLDKTLNKSSLVPGPRLGDDALLDPPRSREARAGRARD